MSSFKFLKASGIYYEGQLKKIVKSKDQLTSIYEALTNSFEAIKLLNKSQKHKININLYFISNQLFSNVDKKYSLSKVIFEDNGIGFNDDEFDRFCNLHKDDKGFNNKGSGRIQFMHFFRETIFESIYVDKKSSTGFYKRVFKLSKSEEYLNKKSIICYSEPEETKEKTTITKVTLNRPLIEGDKEYFNKLTVDKLKEKIKEHYLYYFCENVDSLPYINIKSFINEKENEETNIDSNDIPKEDKSETISIKYKKINDKNEFVEIDKEEKFTIKAFKISKKDLNKNDLKLISKNELVRGDVSKNIELDVLSSEDIVKDNRYLFLISSPYIDSKDSDNRGDIDIYTEKYLLENISLFSESEAILLDDIQNEVNSHILVMYNEILELKKKHKLDIDKLQKMFLLDKKILKKISFKMKDSPETILKKVYQEGAKIIATNDAQLKEKLESLDVELNAVDTTGKEYQKTLKKKISSLVEKIPLQNKVELAHSVARRKLVLELFDKILNKELDIQNKPERNIDEKLLHNLIFKQSSTNPNESDLWIINEDFIYFKGSSEEKLGNIKLNGETILKNIEDLTQEEKDWKYSLKENRSLKKPDILLFPNEGKCIILEFKNPDVNVSSHLSQINNYATLIWNLSKDEFQFHTFYGYFIGEKINAFDVKSHNASFIESHHFDYLFSPSQNIAGLFGKQPANIYTEVIKYSTLLKRAKKRNELFINKLMGNK